jgi:manganese oxidase
VSCSPRPSARALWLGALVLSVTGALAGCSEEEAEIVSPPTEKRDPLTPYPPTGVTKEFSLSIEDHVAWEVGPGAVYDALTYNGQIPGPPIEANAGDRILVHVTNHASEPHSVHTHVVRFAEGDDGTEGSLVAPGETRTYTWDAVFAGTFPYHDHGMEAEGVARGLFGALIVHAPDEPPANEHIVVLADFDTTKYLSLPGVADPVTGEFPDAGMYRGGHQYMHTINGKGYQDAVPAFHGKMGELSRWRVVSIGREFHTWHIHGHRWLDASGVLTDNIQLGPGLYSTFEFREDNPGTWLVHCHVPDHMEGGMMAEYMVEP